MTPDRLIGLKEVRLQTSLGTTTIYRLMGEGKFPQSTKIDGFLARWSESEIQQWIVDRLAERKR